MRKKCHLSVCFICSFSTGGKEEETGKGAGEGSVVQEKEGGGRETGRKIELLTEEEREGGTTWKNRSVTTVQQACIGVSVVSVHWYHQPHCLISNK